MSLLNERELTPEVVASIDMRATVARVLEDSRRLKALCSALQTEQRIANERIAAHRQQHLDCCPRLLAVVQS